MKKFNEELIEKFRNGEISIHFSKNNDSLVDLKNVLRKAFPLCAAPLGNHSCYYRHQLNIETWSCDNLTRAHHTSISDFFIEEPEQWQPKEGEIVEVKIGGHDKWHKRIFLYSTQNKQHICVSEYTEKEYQNGNIFNPITWDEIRQIQPEPKYFNDSVAEKLGRPLTPADLKIIEVTKACLTAEKEQQQQS